MQNPIACIGPLPLQWLALSSFSSEHWQAHGGVGMGGFLLSMRLQQLNLDLKLLHCLHVRQRLKFCSDKQLTSDCIKHNGCDHTF